MARLPKRTRRANGEGSFWREGKSYRWRKQYIDPLTGKPDTANFSAQTQVELNRKIAEFKKSLEQAGGDYTDMTLREWLDEWLATKRATKRAKTYIGYKSVCNNHIIPAMGDYLIVKIRQPHVQKFLDGLCDAQSPSSVATVKRVFRAAMNSAVASGIISTNPVLRTETPRIPKKLPVSLEVPDMQEMLMLAFTSEFLPPSKDDSTIYLRKQYFIGLFLAMCSAFRSGELFALTWDCVHDDGVIEINKTVEYVKGGPRFGPTKTLDSVRKVIFPIPIINLLRLWQQKQNQYALKFGEYYDNANNLVFTNSVGNFVDRQNLQKRWWTPLRQALGIPTFKWKDLRSSAITYYASHGVEPRAVSAMAGHTDIRTTLSYYVGITTLQEAKRLEVADEMVQLLLPESPK